MKDLILEYYIQHHHKFENELSFFRYHLDFDKVLKHAILSYYENDKRFEHQKRIKKSSLENTYYRIIKDANKLLKANNFEEIYKIVENNKASGFNKLCCYDSALRIAEYRRIPIVHIYLQAGSLEGAKKLCKVNKKRFLDKNDLPKALRIMEEKVIENFLCVMKDKI